MGATKWHAMDWEARDGLRMAGKDWERLRMAG